MIKGLIEIDPRCKTIPQTCSAKSLKNQMILALVWLITILPFSVQSSVLTMVEEKNWEGERKS